MEKLFLTVLNMSISAAYVILAILVLRLLLRRAPKKWSYLLWSAAAFRLLCPVSLKTAFSLFRLLPQKTTPLQYVPQDIGLMARPEVNLGIPAVSQSINTSLPAAQPMTSVNPLQIWIAFGTLIWLIGIGVIIIYSFINYVNLNRKLSTSIRLADNIYQSDQIPSSFILGLIRPRIYIPFGLEGDALDYVLQHERIHLRRQDHLVKALAFLLLMIHWFNPLCWLAFCLMSRDMEMSCDEQVLTQGGNICKAYSTTLLSFAAGRRFPAPGPLAFGETGVKSRIKNALRWKRPKVWVTVLAAVCCVCAVAACTSDPKPDKSAAPEAEPVEVAEAVELDDSFPQPVVDWAREIVEADIAYYNELGEEGAAGQYRVIDAKIVGLTQVNTGTAALNYSVNLYKLEYRLLMDHPEHVVLAGGMDMEDGWITERSSAGDQYILLVSYEDDTGTTRWERISPTNTERIMAEYNRPEMLARYGDRYTAACMELFNEYLTLTGGSSVDGTYIPGNRSAYVENIIEEVLAGDGAFAERAMDRLLSSFIDNPRDTLEAMGARPAEVRDWLCWALAVHMDGMALDTGDVLSTDGLSAAGAAARDTLWTYMQDHSVQPTGFVPGVGTWAADLAHDGSNTLLRLNLNELAAQGYTTPHLLAGETRVDLDPISTSHAGWNTYALTRLNGQTYLFQYLPYSATGAAFYQYNLYDIQGGTLHLAEHGETEFTVSMPYAAPDNDVDTVMAFVERVNALWENSRLLVTTDQAVIGQIGLNGPSYYLCAEPTDVGYREQLAVLDGELGEPDLTPLQKLRKLNVLLQKRRLEIQPQESPFPEVTPVPSPEVIPIQTAAPAEATDEEQALALAQSRSHGMMLGLRTEAGPEVEQTSCTMGYALDEAETAAYRAAGGTERAYAIRFSFHITYEPAGVQPNCTQQWLMIVGPAADRGEFEVYEIRQLDTIYAGDKA
jgi:beta-lactamase regulating signal transducer with metallopeptidase domain/uncharacterized protein (DUF736 family)